MVSPDRAALISKQMEEIGVISEVINKRIEAANAHILANGESLEAYKQAMRTFREVGEAYLDLGSRVRRVADIVEPIIDEMIKESL